MTTLTASRRSAACSASVLPVQCRDTSTRRPPYPQRSGQCTRLSQCPGIIRPSGFLGVMPKRSQLAHSGEQGSQRASSASRSACARCRAVGSVSVMPSAMDLVRYLVR